MGDVAMSAPVLESFSQKYGDEIKVVMLTPRFYRPFFFKVKNLEFHDIDLHGIHNGVRGVRTLYKELTLKYKFDVVVDLNRKLYSRLLCRFFKLAGVPRYSIDKGRKEKKLLTQFPNKNLQQLETSINRYCEVFKKAGFEVTVKNRLPELNRRTMPPFAKDIISNHISKNRANSKECKELNKQISNDFSGVKLLGIAPFAKHKGKTLPLDNVRSVIEEVTKRNENVVIFIFGGGRLEKMIADSLVAWYPNVYSAIGRCNLEQEMDLMSNLDVMLSMDSSAMHLCSLLGVRVVSVWGATHKYAGFLGLGQSDDDIVEVELECRPCSIYGNKDCMWCDNRCMQMITSAMVWARLERYL